MPVDLPYPEEEVPVLLNCTVLNTPATAGDKLYVQVPALSANNRLEVNWEPHGGTYPTAGTGGLVALDETGHGWLLMWIGGWS